MVSSVEILREECGNLVRRDLLGIVVQVHVVRAGDDIKLFVVAFQCLFR